MKVARIMEINSFIKWQQTKKYVFFSTPHVLFGVAHVASSVLSYKTKPFFSFFLLFIKLNGKAVKQKSSKILSRFQKRGPETKSQHVFFSID